MVAYKEAFFDENNSVLCIVMEFADGGDLLKKVEAHQKKGTCFSERDVWKYFIQMVRGLLALHELKICHRDLKCANIFLTADGVVKLGDLNVSKVAKKVRRRVSPAGPALHANRHALLRQPRGLAGQALRLQVRHLVARLRALRGRRPAAALPRCRHEGPLQENHCWAVLASSEELFKGSAARS